MHPLPAKVSHSEQRCNPHPTSTTPTSTTPVTDAWKPPIPADHPWATGHCNLPPTHQALSPGLGEPQGPWPPGCTSAGGPWGAVLPRTWAAAAAAPARAGAGRMLEFWECLPPHPTPPPPQTPSPCGTRPVRAAAAGSHLSPPKGARLLFLFLRGAGGQVWGSDCSADWAVGVRDPRRTLRARGLVLPRTCRPLPPSPLFPVTAPMFGGSTPHRRPQIQRQGPSPARKCRERKAGARGSGVPGSTTSLAFTGSGPGHSRDLRGWFWGATPAAKSPHLQL